jgi:hypothetical protein
MKKTTTLILFYAGVAVVCAAILALVNFLILPGLKTKGAETIDFANVGRQRQEAWFPIGKDLVATNQAGETVKLSVLRG